MRVVLFASCCAGKSWFKVSSLRSVAPSLVLNHLWPGNTCSTTCGTVIAFIFCCLVFFVVWAFRVFYFVLFGRGRVLFFAVWAGATPLPKQQKMKYASARTAKNETRPPPHCSTPKLALHARGHVFVCCLGGGRGGGVWVCLLFGRGRKFTHLPPCLDGL